MIATQNQNDNFFGGNYKEVWRRLIPPGLSEVECSFIAEVANLQPGDNVLDLMCGYGRHSLPLGKMGFSVTAVDNAEAYIEEIKQQAALQILAIEGTATSVLEAQWQKKYRAAICMGNSFAFFDNTQAIHLLHKIADVLEVGAPFIINTWMIAEIAIRHFKDKEWMSVDGYKYMLENRFLFQPTRIESEHTLLSTDGTVETLQGVDYIFTLAELENMFRQTGFKLLAVYSTPRKRPFQMGDTRAYIVAVKE